MVEGAKGDFVWLVFEHEGKDPKNPSQPIYGYSFDLLRIQNGKIQEHGILTGNILVLLLHSFHGSGPVNLDDGETDHGGKSEPGDRDTN